MYIGKWYAAVDPNAEPQVLADALDIRYEVFVNEQGCSAQDERDDWDNYALHAVIYADSTVEQLGIPVATARMYYDEGHWRIGRVACLKPHRKKGYGDAVMRMLLWRAWEMNAPDVHIHAQIQAQGFYEQLGFEAFGPQFFEEGIPHTAMVLTAEKAALTPCKGQSMDKQ